MTPVVDTAVSVWQKFNYDAAVVTNDYNLNKVCEFQNVSSLGSINTLA